MTLGEILSLGDPQQAITELKRKRETLLPPFEINERAVNPALHPINNKDERPDKTVVVDAPDGGEQVRKEKVARIAIALQRLIVDRAVAFTFGLPVRYEAAAQDESQSAVMQALNAILADIKGVSHDRQVARSLFTYQDVAELWYPIESETEAYGFSSRYKLRCRIFSPDRGDTLYPYFNDEGDLIAFSRAFAKVDDDDTRVTYFETFTAQAHYLWTTRGGAYALVEGYPKANPIGKIPVVYAHQPRHETADVDNLIDRLEKLLSNFADTNDYHASPKIVVPGHIDGFSRKGETGAVLEVEDGCQPYYLSWQNAPESVKLEIETLLKMIYTITQTPDLSFDAVKGLGAVSGIALKMLFLDAHLKVQTKREMLDEFLQRRASVIKAFIGMFNVSLATACRQLTIIPHITPYMLTDESSEVNTLLAACGGKAVMTRGTAVRRLGMSPDPEREIQMLDEEDGAATASDLFNPTE